MNTRILLTIGLLSILSVFCYGQSGFPYQAVLRDDIGSTINNQEISIRFSIYQGDNASLQDELIINKSELEIPNGVLIFSANDGNRTESQKVILF